jgi:hypothetical protein
VGVISPRVRSTGFKLEVDEADHVRMAFAVIEILGRYFNLNGWSGKLAAGMLAAAALLLLIAGFESVRQKLKRRSSAIPQTDPAGASESVDPLNPLPSGEDQSDDDVIPSHGVETLKNTSVGFDNSP